MLSITPQLAASAQTAQTASADPAPGGGAPPGPVRFIGNTVHANAGLEDKKRRLHLGSGPTQIPGWLNVDGDAACQPDVVMDFRQGLTLPDNSADFIYSEHVFEHFALPQAQVLFAECLRVLRPGGVMRTAMPSLRDSVLFYLGNWRNQDWLRDYPQIDSPAHMLNVVLREWGHLYVYDQDELALRLSQAGFVKLMACPLHESAYSELRNLELRVESTLIIEASKP